MRQKQSSRQTSHYYFPGSDRILRVKPLVLRLENPLCFPLRTETKLVNRPTGAEGAQDSERLTILVLGFESRNLGPKSAVLPHS